MCSLILGLVAGCHDEARLAGVSLNDILGTIRDLRERKGYEYNVEDLAFESNSLPKAGKVTKKATTR